MQTHQIKFPKTAHYATIGTAGKHIKRLWICCHGYGQLVNRFINKFTEVDDDETFIVAPEGLSRFYFGGSFTGDVAASWMTRGDRLMEIEDYCNWLDAIYDMYVPQMSDDVEITVLGFSQGTATIFRWMHARQRPCHNVISWAGGVPEDISYLHLTDYFQSKRMINVYGLQDQFLTPKRLEFQRELAEGQQLKFEIVTFEGKHVIDRPTLRMVGEMLK